MVDNQHSTRRHIDEMYVIARSAMDALKRLRVVGRFEPMVDAQAGLGALVNDGFHGNQTRTRTEVVV